jgi:hypothetical protein
MYVCVCLYICIYIYICVYAYIYIHMCVYIYIMEYYSVLKKMEPFHVHNMGELVGHRAKGSKPDTKAKYCMLSLTFETSQCQVHRSRK